MSFRKLQREWYAKARASGFEDLEGPTGEGPLSDRGNLHPITEDRAAYQRLGFRIEDGTAYTEWAESVLHSVSFRSQQERDVWRLHASGLSEVDIGTALTIARRSVRRHLTNTRERVSEVSRKKRWRDQKKQRTAEIRALVTRSDPRVLAKLVAVMMRQQGHASR